MYRYHCNVLLLVLIGAALLSPLAVLAQSSCPSVCACKWKGGKQTVECIDRALITIPDTIDPTTQVLDMSDNNLQIISRETFIRAGLLNLQKIYLRNCRLGQIDDEAFNGLTNLVDLDLSHNLLTAVPSATLSFISSLRDFTLAGNPIQKIESEAFRTVPHLVKLDLSHCEIQTIAPLAFAGLESLHTLKLNGNKLSELRARTVETLTKLSGIELHDNPWMCDCRMRPVKIWLSERNIPYPVAPLCSGGPERVIDRSFAELHVDDFACRPDMLPMRRFVEATIGENATIICRTHAIPAAKVSWFLNGRQMLNNTMHTAYQRVYIYEDGGFEKRSRLVITNAQDIDSGDFYCVAENRAGLAEANFTLHVSMRAAGIRTLGEKQIAGLSAALIILIVFILSITGFLVIRLRRMPMTESKTPGQLEVITSVSPTTQNANGKVCTTPTNDYSHSPDRKASTLAAPLAVPAGGGRDVGTGGATGSLGVASNDVKFANPVQKPPRLTDLPYSTQHYDGGSGSLILPPSVAAGSAAFGSPTASAAGNNPDLINDTRRSTGDLTEALGPSSGDYNRAGCDSLYPSGLWETSAAATAAGSNSLLLLDQTQDLYMKRAASGHMNGYVTTGSAYSDKMPIVNMAAVDDVDTSVDYLSRTFPRTNLPGVASSLTSSYHPMSAATSGSTAAATTTGYPSDYGLPIVPGAMMNNNSSPPINAKTLRVWQKGGVPVLPPVTALKRALTNSRNSPDEGYQEGCGTDV